MPETLDQGVVIPQPGDAIHATGVAAMRALGASANAAVYAASPFKGTLNAALLASGYDDAFTMPKGSVTIPNVTYANQVANLPEALPGLLTADMNDGSPIRFLQYAPHGRDYKWETQTQNVSGGFMPWRKISAVSDTVPGSQQDLGQMATVQRQVFKRRRGGVIGTGGRAVIALRWDHGLNNFVDLILPHLIRLGLPGSMAMNSADNRWALSESSSVTPEQLNNICRDNGIELWNHSQTHGAANTLADLTREIVTGKADLQAKVPSVPVEGFVIPGVPSGNYAGFSAGEDPAKWDTYAGRLILGHHGASSSHMPGTDMPLMGDQQILGRQVSIDNFNMSQTIAAVDQAVARNSGAILFLHPSQLDLAGKISTSQYVLALEHIAALRDQGKLDVLTMGGLSVADSGREYRHDLIVDGAFAEGVAQWGAPSGWVTSSQGGVTSATMTALTQTVDLTGREWLLGGARDLVLRVKERNANALTVAISVGDRTEVRTIPAGATEWTDIHIPQIIPLESSMTKTISINRQSGGYIHVQSIRWVSI